MPTEFTDCDECNYMYWLDINHKFNVRHKKDLEVNATLMTQGIPEHACKQIIKESHELTECKECKIKFKYNKANKLCTAHYERAIKYGKHYKLKNAACDRCCWDEVT